MKNKGTRLISDLEFRERVTLTLYGDGNGTKGMAEKVDEMHNFFIGAKFAGKIIMGILGILGVLGLSATHALDTIKNLFYHQ
jgi:hypothetical protein